MKSLLASTRIGDCGIAGGGGDVLHCKCKAVSLTADLKEVVCVFWKLISNFQFGKLHQLGH